MYTHIHVCIYVHVCMYTYIHVYMYMPWQARPLYKLLIGLPVGYEDVKDFDRELAAGVESVLVRRVYALCVRACVSVGGCWCV